MSWSGLEVSWFSFLGGLGKFAFFMQLNYQSREERSLKSNLYLNAKSLTTYASQMWNDYDSINQFEIVYTLPQWFNNGYLRTRWSITWLCFKTKFSKLIILTLKRFLIELVSGLSSKMPVQKRSNFRDTGTGSDVSLWKCFFEKFVCRNCIVRIFEY